MKHLAPLFLIAVLAACGETQDTGPAPHDTRPWAENALSKEDPDKLYVFITGSGLWDTASMCRLHWKGEDERFKARQAECTEFVKTATKAFQEGGYRVTNADTGSIALWDWYLEKRDAIRDCKRKQKTVSGMANCDPSGHAF